jgi:hypothetical protein
MYESPVAATLAESADIALLPSSYLKHSGLLDQMRREILCDGSSLVQADSTSASVRGNAIITSSVNLMTQLYTQVDSSTFAHSHARAQWAAGDRVAAAAMPGSLHFEWTSIFLCGPQSAQALTPCCDCCRSLSVLCVPPQPTRTRSRR